MAVNDRGTKNEPIFFDSEAPDIAVDPNEVAVYAAKVGNRRIGTTADRIAATGKDLWEGLAWWDTDLDTELRYIGSGWVLAGEVPQSYTPAWTSTGTAPAVGAGTLTGEYTVSGKRVTANILLVVGTGTSGGTGSWRFSLPFAAANNGYGIAQGHANLAAGRNILGGIVPAGTQYVTGIVNGAATQIESIGFVSGNSLLLQATYDLP